MDKLLGICLTSRDNYSMLDEWLSLFNYSEMVLLNIDVGSTPENIEIGKQICKKHNVNFIISDHPGMQICLDKAADFFDEQGINWFIYTHQDTYPLKNNFFDELTSEYLPNLDSVSVGLVGFNIYHDFNDLKYWDPSLNQYMTLARTPLELGDGYYRKNKTSRANFQKFEKEKPFYVEIPMWSTVMISVKSYKKYIIPDKNFDFFLSVDDIAMQYLNKNIPNIAIPNLVFAHDQSLKLKHKLPYKSPILDPKERKRLYGRFDAAEVWKKKWGFRYNVYKSLFGLPIIIRKIILKILNFFLYDHFFETIGRKDFDRVKDRYKGTLIYSFYEHDPINGPIKYFDIS